MNANLTCLRKNTVVMLMEIQNWLQQPKVLRFVCFVSSTVGLFCYFLSSSFNHLFGKWTWWKILLSVVFSFIICLAVLFAKAGQLSTSPRLEANMAFLFLMITSVYSFFFDKEVKGKPDAFSLVSCAAFAIMSLGLSRLSHFGFEIDLLYFFSGVLTIQLMKIKLWLVIVGGSFNYLLLNLRSTLDALPTSEYPGLQVEDQVDIEIGSQSQSQSQGTIGSASQVDSPQAIVSGTGDAHLQIIMAQEADASPEEEYLEFLVTLFGGNTDRDNSIRAGFMGCIEALKKENGSVISAISKHVGEYFKANVLDEDKISVPKLHRDDNLLVDSLPSGIINDLCESVKQMVLYGFEKECLHVYSSWRREFLKESVWTSGLQFEELNMEDIDKMEKTESWIKALNVAARILFPNERKLCDRVFRGSISSWEFVYTEVCTELATSLLSTAIAFATWSHFIPNTLQELRQVFESVLLNEFRVSLRDNTAVLIRQMLSIFEALENVSLVPRGGLHPITTEVMFYICYAYKIRDNEHSQGLEEGKLSPPVYIVARMTELLESSLKANSKNYNNPTLGFFSIMNNRRFIELEAKLGGLEPVFDDDWLQKNTTKFQQNLELYQSSSWNKILEFLKLDINESEPNVVAELMKDKLYWFNKHFDETCNVQSEWSVCDGDLREQIIKSIENILLPAYGNFIGKFQDFLGKHTGEYIKYGMFDVLDRLNNLFLVRKPEIKRRKG